MRFITVLAVVTLAGCASEKLAPAPPAGVDFSGSWSLNVADSDDPQRLIQAQFNAPTAEQSAAPSGGGGGRGGRQGGGRGGVGYSGGPGAPLMPPVAILSEGLRWPGKQLELKQVAGVVAFISEGINRVCQPTDAAQPHRHHSSNGDANRDSSRRDAPPRARDTPAARCGWADKTLIVRAADPDDEHPPFEEHYSLADDGRRLVEVVEFRGGRSSGFTMSRVWDRTR